MSEAGLWNGRELAAWHECAHALYYLQRGCMVTSVRIRWDAPWRGVTFPGPEVRKWSGEEEARASLVGIASEAYWDSRYYANWEKRRAQKDDVTRARAALGGDLEALRRCYVEACAWVEENAQAIASLTLDLLEGGERSYRLKGWVWLPHARLVELWQEFGGRSGGDSWQVVAGAES